MPIYTFVIIRASIENVEIRVFLKKSANYRKCSSGELVTPIDSATIAITGVK